MIQGYFLFEICCYVGFNAINLWVIRFIRHAVCSRWETDYVMVMLTVLMMSESK